MGNLALDGLQVGVPTRQTASVLTSFSKEVGQDRQLEVVSQRSSVVKRRKMQKHLLSVSMSLGVVN